MCLTVTPCITVDTGREDAIQYLIKDRGYTPMRAVVTVDEYIRRKSNESDSYVSYLEFYNMY